MFNIQDLIDDAKCFATVRELRWPEGVKCPHCGSSHIIKRGFHNNQAHRQRYRGKECGVGFDDLTETVFEGHHQPLKVWVLCLYFMGLNLSNQQIAAELGLNKDDVQDMTSQLREEVVVKKSLLA
jgi:transposase-like protein